ncbi:MAG: histone deacetylase [Candidatus Methanomethylicia archaeon]
MEEVAVVYSKDYLSHKVKRHLENPLRIIKIWDALSSSRIYKEGIVRLVEPRLASEEEVKKVHSEELILKIKNLASHGGGRIAPDTMVSENSYYAALLAAGGGLKALEEDLERTFVLCRPPGHHAERDRAKGFCLLNNIAIVAKRALEMGYDRVCIFDWDSHHGDGTQKIFYEEPNVMYISIHQDGRTLYPRSGNIDEVGAREGEGTKINIPLPPNSTGSMAQKCFIEVAVPIIKQFKPEIILISAGYDGHWSDNVSDLRYTTETYYNFTKTIINDVVDNNTKIIAMLEGGYDLKYMPYSVIRTLEAMCSWEGDPIERELKMNTIEKRFVEILIKKLKKILSRYWKI